MKNILLFSILLLTSCYTPKSEIKGDAMYPTFKDGDTVYIEKNKNKLTYGDIIYYKFEGIRLKGSDLIQYNRDNDDFYKSLDGYYISRIIAIEGDTISILNNVPIINGTMNVVTSIDNRNIYEEKLFNGLNILIHNDTTSLNSTINNSEKIVVQKNSYYVLSDNRSSSIDSRYIGVINSDDIIGIVKSTKDK